MKTDRSIGDYLLRLEGKGFRFTDDMVAFIYFGKKYTEASDELVAAAVEVTIKAQKHFDNSFFLSVLERLQEKKISNRKQALSFAKEQRLI